MDGTEGVTGLSNFRRGNFLVDRLDGTEGVTGLSDVVNRLDGMEGVTGLSDVVAVDSTIGE
jgi:hypothetical protein